MHVKNLAVQRARATADVFGWMADAAIDRLTAAPTRPRIRAPSGDGKGSESPQDEVRRLVARARDRADREAFGELYRIHYPGVFRVASFHLGPVHAEDAVAETFLRAWKGLPRYRDTGVPFSAWLYGIARHIVADEFRRRSRSEPRADPPDRSQDGAEDDRLALASAIERLPKDQRRVIELRYLLGLSNSEIAGIVGKSPGAINSLRWRALQALRGMVDR